MRFTKTSLPPLWSHRRWLSSLAVAVTFSTVLATATTQAETYLSTMGVPGMYGLDIEGRISLGFAFTTDDLSYQLDSVTARLSIGSMVPVENLDLGARLFAAGSNGFPSSAIALGTFSHATLTPGSPQDILFTPDAYIELDANSSYIFVISPLDQNYVGSTWYAREVVAPGTGWNAIAGAFSEGKGNAWHDAGYGGYVLMASVNATEAIPEPSTWMLLGGAGALLGWRLRRR